MLLRGAEPAPDCGWPVALSPPKSAPWVRGVPEPVALSLPPIGCSPEPSVWSALEYTAHVRDMLEWMADAIGRMNREREPTVDWFDPDQRALDDRYNDQDPVRVLDGLTAAADRLAVVLRDVDALRLEIGLLGRARDVDLDRHRDLRV